MPVPVRSLGASFLTRKPSQQEAYAFKKRGLRCTFSEGLLAPPVAEFVTPREGYYAVKKAHPYRIASFAVADYPAEPIKAFELRFVSLLGFGATSPDATPAPSPADEAEDLVRRAASTGVSDDACAIAVERLREAYDTRSPDVVLWLSTCARLRAGGAATIVRQALESPWSEEGLIAAVDAARAVVAHGESSATVAELLRQHGDSLLSRQPFVAGRALMGSLILLGPGAWGWLAERMDRWPPVHLQPAIRIATRQLSSVPPAMRPDLPNTRQLATAAPPLLDRLKVGLPAARFALADVLELMSVIWPLIQLRNVCQELVSAYATDDSVVRAGAAVSMRSLAIEETTALEVVVELTKGFELIRAALTAPAPAERA